MLSAQQEKFLFNKKILLAYESKPVSTIIVNMCRDRGSNAIIYGNCEEMVIQAESFQPDIVFCELSMKPMDGVLFSRFIRTKFSVAIPIIVLIKNFDPPEKLAEAKITGPVQSLKIPFSLNDVAA